MTIDPTKPASEQHPDSPMPGEPEPLSPGRTGLDPDDEPGVDELPDSDVERPGADDAIEAPPIDGDLDQAETDQAPNPR